MRLENIRWNCRSYIKYEICHRARRMLLIKDNVSLKQNVFYFEVCAGVLLEKTEGAFELVLQDT